MDNLGKVGGGDMASIFRVEPKFKSVGQPIGGHLGKIVANEHIIPPQMLDRQRGIADGASYRFEREDVFWPKLYNFMSVMIFDKIKAVQRLNTPLCSFSWDFTSAPSWVHSARCCLAKPLI